MFGRGNCGPKGRFRAKFMGGPFADLFAGGMGSLLEGIELADEQIEQIAELRHQSFAKMAHGRVDMMEARHQLLRELAKPQIDRAKINELKEQIKEQKAQMTDMMIDKVTSFAEILTAEQRKKLKLKRIRQFLGSGFAEGHEHGEDHHHHHEHD